MKKRTFFKIKFAHSKNRRIFAFPFREHSSVGLEHLPYKQRVGGSTPSAPTKKETVFAVSFFVYVYLIDWATDLASDIFP